MDFHMTAVSTAVEKFSHAPAKAGHEPPKVVVRLVEAARLESLSDLHSSSSEVAYCMNLHWLQRPRS